MKRLRRILPLSVFAVFLVLMSTVLWFEVETDCAGQEIYTGCPRQLPSPLSVLAPYGLAAASFVTYLAVRAKVAIADSWLMILVVSLLAVVLVSLDWWLTGTLLAL